MHACSTGTAWFLPTAAVHTYTYSRTVSRHLAMNRPSSKRSRFLCPSVGLTDGYIITPMDEHLRP